MTTTDRTILVSLAGEPVALCTPARVWPSPVLTAMPDRHPDRALAEAKCLIAGTILTGDVDGPYDDQEAEQIARGMLAAAGC